MTKYIHPDETLNIYYRVSEDTEELEDIVKIERNDDKKEISDIPDLQNTKIIQWSPDSEHEDEEFEFDIDEFGTQKIKVSKELLIDNFEDYPEGPYKSEDTIVDYYTVSGSENIERSQNSNSAKGSYSAGRASESDHDYAWSLPGDGLSNYPEPEDTIRCLLRDGTTSGSPSNTNPTLFYSVENSDNPSAWGFSFHKDNNEFNLYKIEDLSQGSNSDRKIVKNETVSLSTGVWYWLEVQIPNKSEHQGKLYETDLSEYIPQKGEHIATITHSDSDYTGNRGIGWGFLSTTQTSENSFDWLSII